MRATAALVCAVVVAPSALLAAFAAWVGHGQALVNLDLVAVLGAVIVLARLRPRWAAPVGAALVALVAAVAVLRSLGTVYIADPALVLDYLGFVDHWPWRLILLGVLAFAVLPAVLTALLARLDCAAASLWAVPALLLGVLAADVAAGSSRWGGQRVSTPVNIATSSAWQVWVIGWQWAHTPRFQVLGPTQGSLAQDAWPPAPANHRVLSVAVESWGAIDDPAARQAIVEPLLRRVAGRYAVDLRLQPYRGGTLAGEFRELCGLLVVGVPSLGAATGELTADCLPRRLAGQGVATWAAHANVGAFYNRSQLYPALGFAQVNFGPELAGGQGRCPDTLFEGPCDALVLKRALAWLAGQPRGLAHVMTLETHLPLRARRPGDEGCPRPLALEPALCLYVNRLAAALDEIGEAITATGPGADVVYVYGDHAPPFAQSSLRERFDRSAVPWMRLRRLPGAA